MTDSPILGSSSRLTARELCERITLFNRFYFIKNSRPASMFGAIRVLRNTGGWGVKFPEKSITKVYASILLVLRGGGWVSIF